MVDKQYNNNTPQPTDIPRDDQNDFLNNFMLLNDIFGRNHTPFGNTIEHATRASPTIITSTNHGLESGDTITVSHTKGIRDKTIKPWGTYGGSTIFGPGPYTVTVINENTFSVPVDASTFIEYYDAEPGDWLCTTSGFEYGWHKFINLPQPIAPDERPTLKKSALYTQVPQGRKSAQLFFSNNAGSVQLTSLKNASVRKVTEAGMGLRTPFGYIINFGLVKFDNDGIQYDFPIPYSSTAEVLSLIATPSKQVMTSSGFFSVTVDSASRFTGYFFAPPVASSAKCFYFAIGT